MATIQKAKTLVKRITLSNITSKNDLYMTPLLNGSHGIGKSQIVRKAAEELNGKCFVIEGGLLREGEIGGLPFATEGSNGTTEVRFVKYYVVNQLYQLQKLYYEKLCNGGFLDGNVKIEEKNGKLYFHDFKTVHEMASEAEIIANGEDNRYNVDKYISPETRLKLIESGDVMVVIVMIDEMNRTDQMTQREIMNILLNHRVNGFNLPWFAQFVGACNPSSQNSSYATNEFDPAQISRMCNLRVSAELPQWIEHALENNFNTEVIEALAVTEGIFNQKEASTQDRTEMTPDPRAWEMVSHFYDSAPMLNNTKFFNSEERKELNDDIRKVISGKVGDTAARTLLEAISRKENNIKPAEILTGASNKVDKAIVEKFMRQKSLTKWIIASNVVDHIANNIESFRKLSKSTNEKEKEKGKNIFLQFSDFILLLEIPTQVMAIKRILKVDPSSRLYSELAKYFSKEVIANLGETKAAIRDLSEE